jgi:hypothetical protein
VNLAVNHVGDAVLSWTHRDQDDNVFTRVFRYHDAGTVEELPPLDLTTAYPHINDAGYVLVLPGNNVYSVFHYGPGADGWQETPDFFINNFARSDAMIVGDQRGNSGMIFFDDESIRFGTFTDGTWSDVRLGIAEALQDQGDLHLTLVPPDGYFAAWQPRAGDMLLSRFAPDTGWQPAVEITKMFEGIPPVLTAQRDNVGLSAGTPAGEYVLLGQEEHLYFHDGEMSVHPWVNVRLDENPTGEVVPRVGPALDVAVMVWVFMDLGRDIHLQRWSPESPEYTELELLIPTVSSEVRPEPLVDAAGRIFLVFVDELSGQLGMQRFDP